MKMVLIDRRYLMVMTFDLHTYHLLGAFFFFNEVNLVNKYITTLIL